MKYKNLFIDFDDTLYDTHGNAQIALTELFVHFGLDRYFLQESEFTTAYWEANLQLWSQYAKGEVDRDYLIVERFRRPLSVGMGVKVTKDFCLEVSDWFLDCCADKSGVIDGAHEVMDYLREKGYRMHMCSNGFHEVQYRKLKACGLIDYFDTVILSEDVGVNKPDLAFFQYALEKSGAEMDTTLMIGDNFMTDIKGAMDAGLHTMFFNRWDENFKATEPVDYEINDLREIMNIL